ncbi:MAG: LamG domain-containing protein, partial [Candidatus Azobacteroides sp.]|nr:LamG domain-containing protein [Candidatus Azobacteroides sp.]
MKNVINFVIIVLLLPLLFSCNKKTKLEQALELAGKNRPELEKVLAHYKQEPLKLKAAKFLIENMDTYYSFTSPELDAFYQTVDSIFSLNKLGDNLTKEQDSLLTQLTMGHAPLSDVPSSNTLLPDLESVSSNFLIDNIDRAFEAWKSPFAADMSFDDFCEYLLPYKVGATNHPDFWRSTYKDTFYPYVKFALDTTCLLDSGLVLQYPLVELDGKSYFSLPDHLFDTIPEFTVCCWVNPQENKPWARAFDLGKNNMYYVCFIPNTQIGTGRFEIATDLPYTWDMTQTDSLPLNQRSYIAITYSKNLITFYLDGILKKRIKTNLTNKNLISNYLGKSHYDNDTVRFKGEIDSFRIYNRELNYTEISVLAGKTDLPDRRQRLIDVVRVIRHLNNVNITLDPFIPGGYRPTQLINLKKGSCDDYTVLGAYIFH